MYQNARNFFWHCFGSKMTFYGSWKYLDTSHKKNAKFLNKRLLILAVFSFFFKTTGFTVVWATKNIFLWQKKGPKKGGSKCTKMLENVFGTVLGLKWHSMEAESI